MRLLTFVTVSAMAFGQSACAPKERAGDVCLNLLKLRYEAAARESDGSGTAMVAYAEAKGAALNEYPDCVEQGVSDQALTVYLDWKNSIADDQPAGMAEINRKLNR